MNRGGHLDDDATFGGGGFMTTHTTQTQESGMVPAKNREAQTLLPLTVKQISEAFEASDGRADLQINGVDVTNVKVVGILAEKMDRATDVQFVVDDGTGRIPCLRWVNDPVDKQELERLLEGAYVKVHGHLKVFQQKKQLVVYSVRPITDYNEIAYHFAECIYVHCYNTRPRKLQVVEQVPVHMTNSTINTPSKGYQSGPSNHVSAQYETRGAVGLGQLILNFMKHPARINKEKGTNIYEMAKQLELPVQSVMACMDTLVGEGLVYSTIDEDHFKTTIHG